MVQGMTVSLPRGSRCLLIGGNGAGKTTLLKILGGKHMVPKTAVTVLGQPPFHDTDLTASGRLSYLGGNWDRDIAFAGYSIPLQACVKPSLYARQVSCASRSVKLCLQQRRVDIFLAHMCHS